MRISAGLRVETGAAGTFRQSEPRRTPEATACPAALFRDGVIQACPETAVECNPAADLQHRIESGGKEEVFESELKPAETSMSISTRRTYRDARSIPANGSGDLKWWQRPPKESRGQNSFAGPGDAVGRFCNPSLFS
jgi:hypothetical protein